MTSAPTKMGHVLRMYATQLTIELGFLRNCVTSCTIWDSRIVKYGQLRVLPSHPQVINPDSALIRDAPKLTRKKESERFPANSSYTPTYTSQIPFSQLFQCSPGIPRGLNPVNSFQTCLLSRQRSLADGPRTRPRPFCLPYII